MYTFPLYSVTLLLVTHISEQQVVGVLYFIEQFVCILCMFASIVTAMSEH
jgi:hypothetical protein